MHKDCPGACSTKLRYHARRRLRSFVLSQRSTHVQLSSVTLKRVDATHKSAVLLSDCSFGRAKKATSDRTENTSHSGNEDSCDKRGHLSPVLVAEMCRLVLVVVRCAEDRVLRTFARHLPLVVALATLALTASVIAGGRGLSPLQLDLQ